VPPCISLSIELVQTDVIQVVACVSSSHYAAHLHSSCNSFPFITQLICTCHPTHFAFPFIMQLNFIRHLTHFAFPFIMQLISTCHQTYFALPFKMHSYLCTRNATHFFSSCRLSLNDMHMFPFNIQLISSLAMQLNSSYHAIHINLSWNHFFHHAAHIYLTCKMQNQTHFTTRLSLYILKSEKFDVQDISLHYLFRWSHA